MTANKRKRISSRREQVVCRNLLQTDRSFTRSRDEGGRYMEAKRNELEKTA